MAPMHQAARAALEWNEEAPELPSASVRPLRFRRMQSFISASEVDHHVDHSDDHSGTSGAAQNQHNGTFSAISTGIRDGLSSRVTAFRGEWADGDQDDNLYKLRALCQSSAGSHDRHPVSRNGLLNNPSPVHADPAQEPLLNGHPSSDAEDPPSQLGVGESAVRRLHLALWPRGISPHMLCTRASPLHAMLRWSGHEHRESDRAKFLGICLDVNPE